MLKVPATFDGHSSRADGSYGLRFTTQEATGEELNMLAQHHRQFGWLLFDENTELDVPKERPEKEGKSLSERLYNVQFVYWKQENEAGRIDEPFNAWREKTIEKAIQHYKDKLN